MFARLNALFFNVSSLYDLRQRYVQTFSIGLLVLAVIAAVLTLTIGSGVLFLPAFLLIMIVSVGLLTLANRGRVQTAALGLLLVMLTGLFAFGENVFPIGAVLTLLTASVLMPSLVFYPVTAVVLIALIANILTIDRNETIFGDRLVLLLILIVLTTVARYLVNVGERALKSASNSIRALQTAANIGQEIASILNVEELIRTAARITRLRFDLDEVRITLTDDRNNYTISVGSSAANAPTNTFPIQLAGYDAGRMITSVGRVLSSAELQALQIVSELISASAQNALSFARQAAALNENEKLYGESQRNLDEIARLNQELTRTAWNEYLTEEGAVEGVLMEGDQLVPLFDQVHVAADGTISVPVTLRGEVIGSIEVEPGASALDATEMTQAVAQRLALSLEAARLYEESRLTASREQQINAIAARYQSVSTVDELLRITVEELSGLLGAQHAAIRLARVDEDAEPMNGAHNGGSTR